MAELEFYVKVRESTGGTFQRGPHDYVFQEYNVAPDDSKLRFKSDFASLKNIPNDMENWVSEYEGPILNLIDPYLYCYQCQVTSILDTESVGVAGQYHGVPERYVAFELTLITTRSTAYSKKKVKSQLSQQPSSRMASRLVPTDCRYFACAILAISSALKYSPLERVRVQVKKNEF